MKFAQNRNVDMRLAAYMVGVQKMARHQDSEDGYKDKP